MARPARGREKNIVKEGFAPANKNKFQESEREKNQCTHTVCSDLFILVAEWNPDLVAILILALRGETSPATLT
jgi:hypothetical protein